MPVYRTTFAVDAPASRVWDALTALDDYPEWKSADPGAEAWMVLTSQVTTAKP